MRALAAAIGVAYGGVSVNGLVATASPISSGPTLIVTASILPTGFVRLALACSCDSAVAAAVGVDSATAARPDINAYVSSAFAPALAQASLNATSCASGVARSADALATGSAGSLPSSLALAARAGGCPANATASILNATATSTVAVVTLPVITSVSSGKSADSKKTDKRSSFSWEMWAMAAAAASASLTLAVVCYFWHGAIVRRRRDEEKRRSAVKALIAAKTEKMKYDGDAESDNEEDDDWDGDGEDDDGESGADAESECGNLWW